MKIAAAAIAGLIFGIGLALSGMLDPARVLGFLDIAGGAWDPTLVFVLAGAVGVTAIGYGLARPRAKPVFGESFQWPTASQIDARLLGGAAMFGVGWGLVGYCPGPAVASIGFAGTPTAIFCLALVGGMLLHRVMPAPPANRT
ncbi:MAG: YeeE/YedE family protein [Alphaproteobacteria bacterium]|nr:YeeE/YedE family protein [Alphaproteobacteria bacterium]